MSCRCIIHELNWIVYSFGSNVIPCVLVFFVTCKWLLLLPLLFWKSFVQWEDFLKLRHFISMDMIFQLSMPKFVSQFSVPTKVAS
uniref:Uncharacterized protein n=1 Tax=Rhizophora mucronata TaxID=61149 RepID=A0A2P2QAD1_RHIMU